MASPAIDFPAFDDLPQVAWSVRMVASLGVRWVRRSMLLLAAVLIVPFASDQFPASLPSEGLLVQIILDRSGSMDRDDFERDGVRTSRLAVAKQAIERMLVGWTSGDTRHEGLLRDRGDRFGLVTFAGRPRIDSALTNDTDRLLRLLSQVEATKRLRDDGTAIGDALSAGLERLAEKSVRPSEGGPDRATILLTDGWQNAGRVTVEEATEQCVDAECRVYVISLRPVGSQPTAFEQSQNDAADAALAELARQTNGEVFIASDERTTQRIVETVVSLNRGPLIDEATPARRYWATQGATGLGLSWPPLLLVCVVVTAICVVLESTLLAITP